MAMVVAVKAQDVIVLRNASEIQAKVKSIGQQEVVYLKWDNLDGPTYTLLKSEIFFIKYANGLKDTFAVQPIKPVRAPKKAFNEDFSRTKFQGYSYLGTDFDAWAGGPSLDFSFGARTSKYLYIGAGVGFHNVIGDPRWASYYESQIWWPFLIFTSDIKGYIPTRVKGLYPRFDLSLGGGWDLYEVCPVFYMSFGAGFDYRRFSFGIGYQMPCSCDDDLLHLGYIRLGVRFGK